MLRWPVDDRTRPTGSRAYGAARPYRNGIHVGVDLGSREGEPVYAAADGVVAIAAFDTVGPGSLGIAPGDAIPETTASTGGLMLYLTHPDGRQTRYLHLGSIAVGRGQHVRAGDVIGTIGKTGIVRSTPHLHFELRDAQRAPLDPTPELDATPPPKTDPSPVGGVGVALILFAAALLWA